MHQNGLQAGVHIAKEVGISYSIFLTIAVQLRRKGLLVSVRGQNGGFALGRPATEISFYDVFLCIEEELCISRSLRIGQEDADDAVHDGKVHEFLQTWQDKMIAEMSGKSIADLAS